MVMSALAVTDAGPPRLCRGCEKPLPLNRKSFHNKVCQGTWLAQQDAAKNRRFAKKG